MEAAFEQVEQLKEQGGRSAQEDEPPRSQPDSGAEKQLPPQPVLKAVMMETETRTVRSI